MTKTRKSEDIEFDSIKSNKTEKELIFCAKEGCEEVAYFWCNRNRCDRKYCQKQQRYKVWFGCNQAVCWKHFKFEYFIDRASDEKIILNWHCLGKDKNQQGMEVCTNRRQSRNCCCFCCIMSPMWILILIFFIVNLAIYFQYGS